MNNMRQSLESGGTELVRRDRRSRPLAMASGVLIAGLRAASALRWSFQRSFVILCHRSLVCPGTAHFVGRSFPLPQYTGVTSALPSKTDMRRTPCHVGFLPVADIVMPPRER